MPPPEIIKNYLSKKAFNKWILEWERTSGIENVIVVPAIAEFENIKTLLNSISANDMIYLERTLILFVVNNLCSSNSEVKTDNQNSISFLRRLISKNSFDSLTSKLLESGLNIGMVDVSSDGKELSDKSGGVGAARKIGMDLALAAFDYLNSDKRVIISLDADCKVDSNYLSSISYGFRILKFNAAIIEFSHYTNSPTNNHYILGYEIFLRYYVVGLKYAQSEYAYHTIGSAFACDTESYIKVGGMNTRKAAEDFYFLQKLAKIYKIGKINSTIVRPSTRTSWRVPFGTGKSLLQFQSGERKLSLYNPEVFKVLKHWLELFNSDFSLGVDLLLQNAKNIHPELYNYLMLRNFKKQWGKILNNCNSEKQIIYQRKNWFDAFNTLKLIHHLRDTAFPMQEVDSAIKEIFRLFDISLETEVEKKSDYEKLKTYLDTLIKIENSYYQKEMVEF